MTRSPRKAGLLRGLGAEPVICDETAPPPPPRIHVDDAARQALPSLAAPPGLTIVIDDRAMPQG